MDAYLEGNDIESGNIISTPNIVFQLNRFQPNQPFYNKRVSTNALFSSNEFINKILAFYKTNLDIPIMISGLPGCGKLTTVLGLMPYCLAYIPNILDRNSNILVNNIIFLKVLDENNFPKILMYENLYLCNIATLGNNKEIMMYLEQIYKLGRTRSIDCSRKIFIICHIELCTHEQQRYITFMLDKINSLTSYILITTHNNKIDKKIRTFCANLRFEYPNKDEFYNIFKTNFKSILNNKYISSDSMYKIYKNNNYHIGRTISQIKYLLSPNISIEYLQLEDSKNSLLNNIAANFIKKKMKLGLISGTMEIRQFLYTLISINIDIIEFVQCIIKQLLTSKINTNAKYKILEKAGEFSATLPKMNKEMIGLETFIYELIYIIYSGGMDI